MKHLKLLPLTTLVLMLAGCGGGSGSGANSNAAKTPTNINQTFGRDAGAATCNVNFTWDQSDYTADNGYGVTYTIDDAAGKVVKQATTPVPETATTHNTLPKVLEEFTSGATYSIVLTAHNKVGASAPTAAHSFTPICDQTPKAPTMASQDPVTTVCTSAAANGCLATFNWEQSDYIAGYQTKISIFTTAGALVKSYTTPEQGTSNNTSTTAKILTSGTTYYATLETINSNKHSTATSTNHFTPIYTPPTNTGRNGIWLNSVQDDLSNCSSSGCTSQWMTPERFQTEKIHYIYPVFAYLNDIPASQSFWSGTTFNAANYAKQYVCYDKLTCPNKAGAHSFATEAIGYFAGGGDNIINGTEVTASYKNWDNKDSTQVIPVADFRSKLDGCTGTQCIPTYINAYTTSSPATYKQDIQALAQGLAYVIVNDKNAAGIGFDDEPKLQGPGAELFFKTLAENLDGKLLVVWGQKAQFCDTYSTTDGLTCASKDPNLNLWQIMDNHGGVAMLAAYGSGATANPNSPNSYEQYTADQMVSFIGAAEKNISTPKATFQIAIPAAAGDSEFTHAEVYNYSNNPFAKSSNVTFTVENPCPTQPTAGGSCSYYVANFNQRDFSCKVFQLLDLYFDGAQDKNLANCRTFTATKTMPVVSKTLFSGVTLYHLRPPLEQATKCAAKISGKECLSLEPESIENSSNMPISSWALFLAWPGIGS